MKKDVKILVPIDFSACSDNALAYAMQLADMLKGNLVILNVSSITGRNLLSPVSAVMDVEEVNFEARTRIGEAVLKANERVGDQLDKESSFRIIIEMGNIADTINDVADRNEIDYIVMGTQGENSAKDRYLGTVASNVLKDAPCPVMVIPGNVKFDNSIVIAYATDFMDEDPNEIRKVMQLFSPLQPKIKCVHFNAKKETNEGNVRELKSFFTDKCPELDIECHDLTMNDRVIDLHDFIESHDINMLVMYKPKRSFLESIFHKSYTQKMAKETRVPLLVLKEV